MDERGREMDREGGQAVVMVGQQKKLERGS